MKTYKTAFTLLEILVVMAIIAVLLYMLIQVMAVFRRNVELQQASDQIISGINQTKNFATNNVLPNDITIENETIYAYKLTPEGNNLTRRVCKKTGSVTIWDCSLTLEAESLLANYVQNVVLHPVGCDSLLLINLVNDWQIINSDIYSDGECKLELSHEQDNRVFRTFVFNGSKNTFEVQYGS